MQKCNKFVLLFSFCAILGFISNLIIPDRTEAANSTDTKIENVRISVHLENATISEALEDIESKTIFRFLYNKSRVEMHDSRIHLQYSEASVEQVLKDMSKQTGAHFRQVGQTIAVSFPETNPTPIEVVQFRVAGRVMDSENGELLPGVNIVIKGSNSGTATDISGEFELSVPSLGDTLMVTYIGYELQEVPINGRTELDIHMQPQALVGEELVVTAFGVSRQREAVAYSVSEIDGEALATVRTSNIADNLSGRIAGVNASQMGGGVAGNSSRVIIRGTGSTQGNNQPLYVINGMPMSNNNRMESAFGPGSSKSDKGDGIQHINSDDIESINVLKGGAAAALYGSKAANGVILITTKKGSSQRDGIGVEFNSNVTVGMINRYPKLQSEFGQGVGGQRPQTAQEAYASGRLTFGERISDVEGDPTVNFDGEMRPYVYHSIKDQMQTFYRNSVESSNTLAFDGGVDGVVYRLSLSNLDASNIQPNSGYNRKSANLNMQAMPSEKLTISGTVQYTYDEGHNRPIIDYAPDNVNWGVTMLANTVPIEALAPGYYEDTMIEKEWNHVAIATNPYFIVNRMKNMDSKNRVISQASVTYDILPNLYIKGDLMRDFEIWSSEYIQPIGTAANPNGAYRATDEEYARLSIQTVMGYDNTYHNFNFSTLVGGNIERTDNNRALHSGIDFVIPEFYSFSNLGTTTTNLGVVREGTNSVFGSLDVDYRQIIYLSFTGRQDWFSTLNLGDNSIFYPSVGGSLVLSNLWELPESISFARVRASWAQVGSATVSPYAINETYTLQEGGHLGNPVQLMSRSQANSDLRPLTSTTREVGFDLDFFDRRFGIDFTVYEKKNEDDIISTSLASSSGATSTIINAGEINNRGVELLLTAEPVRNVDFRWRTSYNLGYNRNRVIRLAPDTPEGGTSLIGHPVSMFFEPGMVFTEDGTPVYNSTSNYELRSEAQPMGPGVPPWTMGLSNTFFYKNFSLDVLLDAKFGNYFYSQQHAYFQRFGHAKETLPGREEGLTVTGVDEDGNPFEHYWAPELMDTYYNNQGQYRAMFVQDGSFIKLRSISFGYNIPVGNISFLESAEISVVGRNLAILYSKTEHFDPEQGHDPTDNRQVRAGTQLPRTRNIGMNVNLRF
ncbi:MAG: SusC/RagA family TonB-linked outer membrane protein [Balneolaceae bacterium]